jgi:hypothetical protein
MQSRSFAGKVFAKWSLLSAGLLAGAAGCYTDKPHDYGQERPSNYDLDSRDRGLQSKDVNEAADQMAADLLSDRKLNASKTQYTIVFTSMEDRTIDRNGRQNFDIFLQALQDRLARLEDGRITLIANRDKFYRQRSQEREDVGGPDEFGQTGGDRPAAANAVNPDYALTGTVMDMPNRGTNYYQIQFSLEDMRNRTIPWTRLYAVKVAR